MLKLLSRLSTRFKATHRPERVDAGRIYAKVMKQARNPVFYAQGLVEDSTDGRMEWLTAHLSVVLYALQHHGEDGAKLSQAIYDTMVDDFDIALREEGLSDSGVKHRIKPLAKMFLTRARSYSDAFQGDKAELSDIIRKYVMQEKATPAELNALSDYIQNLAANIGEMALDQIASADFAFPKFL